MDQLMAWCSQTWGLIFKKNGKHESGTKWAAAIISFTAGPRLTSLLLLVVQDLPPEKLTHSENISHSGCTCLHVPARYAGISQWRHNMPVVVCRAGFQFVCWYIFSRTILLSAFNGGANRPFAEEIDVCIRQDRQAKMHSDPDRDKFLLITRYCFTLCKELIYTNSYLCIYSKKFS